MVGSELRVTLSLGYFMLLGIFGNMDYVLLGLSSSSKWKSVNLIYARLVNIENMVLFDEGFET